MTTNRLARRSADQFTSQRSAEQWLREAIDTNQSKEIIEAWRRAVENGWPDGTSFESPVPIDGKMRAAGE